MVKKIKKFIIFILFSFLFSILSGRFSIFSKSGDKNGISVGEASAEEMCCMGHTGIPGDPCY